MKEQLGDDNVIYDLQRKNRELKQQLAACQADNLRVKELEEKNANDAAYWSRLLDKFSERIANYQANELRLRDALTKICDEECNEWEVANEALSTPPSDLSALREVIAKVLEEVVQQIQPEDSYQDDWFRAKVDSYGKVEWLTKKLRSGEWTPEYFR